MEKDNSKKMNRLAGSGSPYLQQHADNFVDWYPWSDDVFQIAETEDKPVFLSIGYSTCHWCHVMEKESFSDPEVAAAMNEAFICVKVDREERPDIDNLYMTVCQLITGSGGWPLTIVMTPDKKPFFAGTYIPRTESHGRPGMLQLIPRIRELWSQERETVNLSAGEIAGGIEAFMAPDPAGTPSATLSDTIYAALRGAYDAEHGGFGSAPKFPVFSNLLFLLRIWSGSGDREALDMVRRTLAAMRGGGIYDQAGYGIHRYSTDGRWFSPHFEKMLYDQALAIITCTECFAATGEPGFRTMAEEIIAYVLRDLLSPHGAFFSAEDADSEGEEGRFYTWTDAELSNLLEVQEMDTLRKAYGVTGEGNFLTETGRATGRNILYPGIAFGERFLLDGAKGLENTDPLSRIREKLMAARAGRVRPLRDEKIMTDWNGLMIAALARAGAVFGALSHIEAARKAMEHLLTPKGSEGAINHLTYTDGVMIPAFLDDYSYLLWGVVELYQATFSPDLLQTALTLAEEMASLFEDHDNGGFFLSRQGSDASFSKLKQSFDGPMPAGNSVAAVNLIRLGRLTARQDLVDLGEGTLRAFAADMAGNPTGFTHMAAALDLLYKGSTEVVIAGDPEGEDTERLARAIRSSFLPDVTAALTDPGNPDPFVGKMIPYSSDMKTINGRAAAYVCRNFACHAPVTDPAEMLRKLSEGVSGK